MSGTDQHQFKDRYMLRLPDGMRERIKAAAESNNRSMNAEIVATLEEAYPAPVEPQTLAMLLVADFIDLVERAGSAEERAESLAWVNDQMRKNPALADFRIGVIEDPQLPGTFAAYVRKANKATMVRQILPKP